MNILAISAHPDDETLGAAGTLMKHVADGDVLWWTIVTSPTGDQWSEEMRSAKTAEIHRAAEAYNAQEVIRLSFPTTRLDTVPQVALITALREVISRVAPEVIYLVHGGDVHTDHRAVFTAAMSVLKPFYMRALGVRRILSFETLSSTDAAPLMFNPVFTPTVFSDITPFIERKIEIMRLFESEAQAPSQPRGDSAIRALARFRGATIGVDYAEAFMLIREII